MLFHDRITDGGDAFQKVFGKKLIRAFERLDESDAVVGLFAPGVDALYAERHF